MNVELAPLQGLSKEHKTAMEKTALNAKKSLRHFSQADDTALGFYQMSNQQRDWLCNSTFKITPFKATKIESKKEVNNTFMAIAPIERHGEPIDLYCGELVHYLPSPLVDKVLCHEYKHRLISTGKNVGSSLSNALQRLTHNVAPTVCYIMGAMASGGRVSPEDCINAIGGGIAGFAISTYSGIVLNYPMRTVEKSCDEFSDRVVPEITYGDFFDSAADIIESNPLPKTGNTFRDFLNDAYTKALGLPTSALGHRIDDALPLQRLRNLSKTHPSNYTRIQRSDKNCPFFLEQRTALGIPSLVLA